jgi:hypothetical protein
MDLALGKKQGEARTTVHHASYRSREQASFEAIAL